MNVSNTLISLGIAVLAIGLTLKYAPWLINWFGKLPGDIKIQNEHSFIFIPITSMIIVSLAITIITNLFFRK
jgi:hypothetical protein